MAPVVTPKAPAAVGVAIVDEEKLYNLASPKRPWYILELFHPTWRLWTALFLAMFIPALVITTTLLALAHRGHAAPSRTKDTPLGPVVDLGYSQYQGIYGDQVNSWLGMRYAQPPLGDLRFKAPQEPKSTDILLSASEVSLYLSFKILVLTSHSMGLIACLLPLLALTVLLPRTVSM